MPGPAEGSGSFPGALSGLSALGANEAIIGLGSNGDPSTGAQAIEMLRRARASLKGHALFRLTRSSPIYESDALLPEGAPADWNRSYLNAACRVELADPGASAETIVHALKDIERKLGRAPAPRWAPRAIDLDLLAWGRPEHRSAEANVPHLSLMERPFALLPAQDCVADRLDARDLRGPSSLAWRYSHPDAVPLRTRVAPVGWPELVGVLNVTPDSFSDGRSDLSEQAIERAAADLLDAGATVIDVGAESTRPGARPVSSEEELARLLPVLARLDALRASRGFKLSLDSRHPETVEAVLEKTRLDWINDVEGFEARGMRELAAASGCDLVVMHSLGVPPRRDRILDPALDPVTRLLAWGEKRIESLSEHGIPRERIILDPGLGFGKTAAQNLAICLRAPELDRLGARVLIGHSRKSFLGTAPERDLETAILTAELARGGGTDFLRVHSPAFQARAITLGSRMGALIRDRRHWR